MPSSDSSEDKSLAPEEQSGAADVRRKKPKKKQRRGWRKWLRRFLFVAIPLLLLLVLFIAFLPAIISSDFVARQIEGIASDRIGRNVELGKLDLSWSGIFQLQDVKIPAAEDEPDQPLLALEDLEVRWAWWPLFSGKLQVDALNLDGLRLTIHRDGQGMLNLLKMIPEAPEEQATEKEKKPGAPMEELPIEALHVRLSDIRIDYIDEATSIPLERTTDAPGSFLASRLRVDDLRVDLPGPKEPLDFNLDGALAVSDGVSSDTRTFSAQMHAVPGTGGYLDFWKIAVEGEANLGADIFAMQASTRERDPGIETEVSFEFSPKAVADFAESALALRLPARAEGVLDGRLLARWDGKQKAALEMEAGWDRLTIISEMIPAENGRLVLDRTRLAVAVETLEKESGALPFSAFELSELRVESPFVEVNGNASIRGVGAEPVPSVAGEIRIDPDLAGALETGRSLGFVPEGIILSESLEIVLKAEADGATRTLASANISGDMTLNMDYNSELAAMGAPPELAGLGAVELSISEIAFSGELPAAGGPLRMRSRGNLRLKTDFESTPNMEAPFRLAVELPLNWHVLANQNQAGTIETNLYLGMDPRLIVHDVIEFDKREKIRLDTMVAVQPEKLDVELSSFFLEVGDWLDWSARAEIGEAAREKFSAHSEITLSLNDDLRSWVPEEFVWPMGGLAWDGEVALELDARGQWNPDEPGQGIQYQTRLTPSIASMQLGLPDRPTAHIDNLDGAILARAAASPQQPVQAMALTVEDFTISSIHSQNMARVENLRIPKTALNYDPAEGGSADWQVQLGWDRVLAVSRESGGLPVALGELRMETNGAADLKPFAVHLDSLVIELEDPSRDQNLISAMVMADYTSATQKIDAEVTGQLLQLDQLAALPMSMVEQFRDMDFEGVAWKPDESTYALLRSLESTPELSGSMDFLVKVEGNIPDAEDLAALQLPLQADVKFNLRNMGVVMQGENPINIEGLFNNFEARLAESGMRVGLDGNIEEVRLEGDPQIELQETDWDLGVKADLATDRLEWRQWKVEVPNWGIRFTMDGYVEGWAPYIRRLAEGDPATTVSAEAILDEARRFRVHHEMRGEIDRSDWTKLPAEGASVIGRAGFFAEADQKPGRSVTARAGLMMQEFSARYEPGIRVEGGNGELAVLLSGRRVLPKKEETPYFTESILSSGDLMELDAQALKILQPQGADQLSELRFDAIRFDPWIVRNLRLRSEGGLRDWSLLFDSSDLMGGTLEGRLALGQDAEAAAADWGVQLQAAFTGVSGKEAIAAWRDLDPEQTELDGVVDLRWNLPADAESPAELLESLEVRLVITRIGSKALQGFLLALDPEEKNPSFVSARQVLRLGRPRYVEFRMKHGLVDFGVQVWSVATGSFYMSLMQRAAVGEAVRLESLQPQLEKAILLRDLLKQLSQLDAWATLPETDGDNQ
ncbi:MAG: AsmA family protein [Candidatus Sumerlaeia bacterium]